ncbi:polysaccharide deacetylase family protein [Flexithrix dorotheae]|uniref:polysaccharide deacetylase family protein n=1 Tax=Flexithrix dorotheae TaxID=70993 RepID=UPI00038138E3|nr:polysaccharide deacetylase family protein [Flexithrix dorotheae]
MFLHKMGWLFQEVLYPSLTWSRYSDEKVIYLTFDDGPIPEMTPEILEILDQFNAKATFFCVGDNVRKYPEIASETLGKGHVLGNHTFNHLNGWNTGNDSYFENIERCRDQFAVLVKSPEIKFFRPPYGRIARSQIKPIQKEYEIIMWDVLSGDFSQKLDKKVCLEKSIKFAQPGSIIVFHDNLKAKKNLDYVLPRYLEYFSKKGFLFKALE